MPSQEIDNTDLVLSSVTTRRIPTLSWRITSLTLNATGRKLSSATRAKLKTARIADMHIALKNGSNIALLNAIGHVIIEEDLYDKSFVASRSEGFEEYRKIVEGYTPESVEEITGVRAQEIRACARMYASAKSAAILWGMGSSPSSTRAWRRCGR